MVGPPTTPDLAVEQQQQENPAEPKHHWNHLLFCPVGALCKAAIIHPTTIGRLSLTRALVVFAYKAEKEWRGSKARDL